MCNVAIQCEKSYRTTGQTPRLGNTVKGTGTGKGKEGGWDMRDMRRAPRRFVVPGYYGISIM